MSGILRITCRVSRNVQCSTCPRNRVSSQLTSATRVRHYHPSSSNFTQQFRARPFLEDDFSSRIVRRAQRSAKPLCWRTRSRNLHSSAGTSCYHTFLYRPLILRVFLFQSSVIWVSIDPLLELGTCSLHSSLSSAFWFACCNLSDPPLSVFPIYATTLSFPLSTLLIIRFK
jgi:hypothetical protein